MNFIQIRKELNTILNTKKNINPMALEFKKEEITSEAVIETKETSTQTSGAEIQEKKKRGRPAGSKNKASENTSEKTEQSGGAKPKTDIEKELAELNSKHSEKIIEGKTITVDKSTQVKPEKLSFLNGYMLLVFSDFLFPTAINYFFKKKMKESGKKTKDLKMTPDERKNLEEIANEAAKEISLGMSPVQMYLIGCAIIYGSKLND